VEILQGWLDAQRLDPQRLDPTRGVHPTPSASHPPGTPP
jgi:hypothetical protein